MRRVDLLQALLTLSLLHEIVAPVGQIEHGKDGGKRHSTDDIDFLGS